MPPRVIWTMLHGLSASLVVQTVKNPPAMWETWVQSLGWEDPLEKGTATHFSILAWLSRATPTRLRFFICTLGFLGPEEVAETS